MIRRLLSRFNLFVIFSFFIFNILWFTLGLSATSIYIMWKAGFLDRFSSNQTFDVFAGIGVLLFVSTAIGSVVTLVGSKLMLSPINEMLHSMKKLAAGDFSTRIDNTGLLRPKEIRDFSDEFNATAQELGGIEMLRSDFVNNFSHEFKTPIVSLRGFAKLLRDENLADKDREEYLDIIISESDRLSNLATNVLNLSKIENQTIVTEKKVFDVSEQIRRMILMMDSKWSEKELDLEVDMEGEIALYGNPELLSQVWVNVLDNAVKFSHQGEKLEIQIQDSVDFVVFKVQDHGLGMDDDTQAHIFDKFYQGDTSRTTEGNGLGMTVVKKIVSLHQGQISLISKQGQGTQVIITLPKQA